MSHCTSLFIFSNLNVARTNTSHRPTTMQLNILRRIVPYLPDIGSPWFKRKLVEMFPSKNVQKLLYITDLVHEKAVGIYQEKKRMIEQGDEALKHKVGEGKDLMSILRKSLAITLTIALIANGVLVRENMAASEDDRLPEEELIGQVA